MRRIDNLDSNCKVCPVLRPHPVASSGPAARAETVADRPSGLGSGNAAAGNAAAGNAAAGNGGAGSDDGARRRQLLDAALGVFLKFGFRKTSMDEVARAASVSRQGLYLHFSKKEELFRAVVRHALEDAFQAAEQRLADPDVPIRERLAGAFDEWVGRYVGMLGSGFDGGLVSGAASMASGSAGGGGGLAAPGVADLGEATHSLVAPLVRQYSERFVELLARFMRSSGLLAAYKPAGLTARQLAETLYATARGFKSGCATRAEFGDAIGKAVRAFCMPLGGRA